jgi:hypothetical protein
MSYDGQKIKMGRMPIYILEVELTYCDNTYGVSPCTAAGASGSECYNCFGTCQDTANFTETTKTYKFSSTRIENGLTFPTILGVSTAPTTLTPAKGIGMRSSCSVQLQDHTWTDVGVDPYVSTRAYNPDNQGSFWGRLLARDPYTEGRKMTLKTGYLDDNGNYDVNNFQSRTYFIDTVTGPDASGRVVITGKDILRFADSTKAQVPTVSQALLTADINTTVTSVGITDTYDDVKNAYDAGQAYIRIDDETMLITGISGSNPTYTLTVSRNALPGVYSGSVPLAEHKENATVQHCHYFNAEEIDDIIYYLLNTGAGIDASYLPTADWQNVIDYGLQSYQFTTLITEPTGVKDLLDELSEHSILMWWDERTQEVKMNSILNRSKDYGPFNDSQHIIADSVAVARDDAGRTSQVWLAFGHRNPVLEMDQLNHYTTIKISADLDLELSTAYGIKKVRTIYSRWLPTELGAVASEIANRLLNYYKVTKKVITMTLDPKDDNAWTGSLIGVATRQRQDATGAAPEYGYRVLEVTEQLNLNGARYQYVLQSTDQDFTRNGLIQPDSNTDDYSDASATVKSRYAFISPDSGTFSDGTAAYEIL